MYSNCGFMAFPLIAAVLGDIGVFYGSAFVGVFLSHCTLRSLFRREVLWPAVLRTVLIPCCYLALLCLLRVSEWSTADASIGTVVLLCAACPSAASSVLMTASLGMDSAYGSRIILMTSILSVISIPILSFLSVLLL